MKPEKWYVCPKCKTDSVRHVQPSHETGTDDIYLVCEKCNWRERQRGSVFLDSIWNIERTSNRIFVECFVNHDDTKPKDILELKRVAIGEIKNLEKALTGKTSR